MMTIARMIYVTCIVVLYLVGTGATTTEADQKILADGNNDFGFSLYRKVDGDVDISENIFLSPFSISSAFAMVYLGAAGNTATEMGQVMNFSQVQGEVHETFKDISNIIFSGSQSYSLKQANKLFGKEGYNFLQKYLDDSQSYYGASLETKDFVNDPEGSRDDINTWVEEQTEQKIKGLLPRGIIQPATILVLVNAIYFKGLWDMKFEKDDTKSEDFRLEDGSKMSVDMMHVEGNFRHGHIDDWDANIVELPYVGDTVAMYIILPDEVTGLDIVEEQITAVALGSIIQSLPQNSLHVGLPKFKITYSLMLSELLKAMGMNDVFSPGTADLSGIDGSQDLNVDEAIHKTYVDVNEEGTEAAGATAIFIVGSSGGSQPELDKFIIDKPFLFMIREKTTGSVLFVGRMKAPPAGTLGETNNGRMYVSNSVTMFVLLFIMRLVCSIY